VNAEIDQPTFDKLTSAGVDERLARHVAHLFIRDPLVIFSERVKLDDAATTEHFENIQSTNWQTMRWKPPPFNVPMGWRVEFRPMEVQFSDFENAAFTVVVMLCARVILFFDLSLYVPLSKVDENMRRAHTRDAVLKQKFFFRKNLVPLAAQCPDNERNADEDAFEEMSVADIIIGKGDNFPGLVPLIWAYLDVIQVDAETRSVVNDYIDLVVQRAKGTLPTPARWIRNFIDKHPKYKHDSKVSNEIATDLVKQVIGISHGEKECHELLGQHRICKLSDPLSVNRTEVKLRHPPGKALRGSSFHSQVGTTATSTYQCAIVRALLEKYTTGIASAAGSPAVKRESIFGECRGFDEARPMFKRTKKG
jgi:glutamate--cysteine ligase catalytic subunit